MSGPDYLFLISNGFSARMICQTDLLPGLRRAGLRVGVLTADQSDASLRYLADEHGVELYQYDVARSAVKAQLFELRKYFLNDIRENPALLEKYMSRKLDLSRSPLQRWQTRLSGVLYSLGRRLPGLRPAYQSLERRLLRSPAAERQLAKIDPGTLVCTYPVMLPEPEFLLAAKALGIPSVLHLLSWDNLSAKGVFAAMADRYLVWGPVMEEELRERYPVQPAEVAQVGVMHFDHHVKAKETLPEATDKRHLFFAMSAPRYGPREIDIVEWLAGQVSAGAYGDDVELVVRPHPQNVHGYMADASWLPRIKAMEELPGVTVLYPRMHKNSNLLFSIDREDMAEFTTALAGASVVLNSGSTVTIDAMMTDRPVIFTSFDAEEERDYWFSARRLIDYLHLEKLIGYGGVAVTTSFGELDGAIRAYLAEPGLHRAERAATVAAFCLAADGRSVERAVGEYTGNTVPREG